MASKPVGGSVNKTLTTAEREREREGEVPQGENPTPSSSWQDLVAKPLPT